MKRTNEIRNKCFGNRGADEGFQFGPTSRDVRFLLDRCEKLEKLLVEADNEWVYSSDMGPDGQEYNNERGQDWKARLEALLGEEEK